MYVKDYFGQKKEVTNLPAALREVKQFASYDSPIIFSHPENDKITVNIKEYWTDLYNKLLKLKGNVATDKEVVRH